MVVDLVSLSIASAIRPGQILICILLLQSPDRGVLKAGCLLGGMTVVRLLQGVVFGSVLTGAAISALHRGQHGVITSTLLLFLGIILLIAAYEQWQHQDDGDGLPPKWLTIIDSLTPVKAFGVGLVLVAASTKFWAFTLSAIAVISEAHLNRLDGIITFLLLILGAESLLLLTILLRIVTRRHMLSLIKSYRVMSQKVVPVRLFASIISRQADGDIGKASWYAGQAIRGLSSPIKADFVRPWAGTRILSRPSAGKQIHSRVWGSKVTSNIWLGNALPTP